MGDRRKGDRRAPEEGVIRIQKKNVWVYGVLIAIFILAVVLNIVTWSAYITNKREYNTLIDHYYNGDSNDNSNNIENNAESVENSNNYSCDLDINANKKSIKAGESIEYEIKVSNINASEGIKAFETYINYDSNLFNCTVKSNEEIAKIVFTAKNDITANNYKVNFTKNKFTAGDDQVFEVADNSIEIKVD